MTKIKPLHVEFRLETWDKKYHILAAKDVLCLSILLTAMDRNGTDWNWKQDYSTLFSSQFSFPNCSLPFRSVPFRSR